MRRSRNHLSSILFSVFLLQALISARAQQPEQTGTTIKAESRLVLVDVIVTDKKGGYISDLNEKDFKVFEDDQEQKIKTFSFERSATSADAAKRHLVLFFDDDAMQPSDQARARQAAMKFLDNNSGPNQYFAIVDYAGTMRVAQNFTNDTARLKQVAGEAKLPTSSALNASLSTPVFNSYSSYSDRNVLLALRSLAKSMASLPGRKSLVWMTVGFPLTPDREPEVTALINACNRANVAIYPMDVRGLSGAVLGSLRLGLSEEEIAEASYSDVQYAENLWPAPQLVYVQAKGGGGGGGGKSGGSTGGSTGGATGGRTGGTGGRPATGSTPVMVNPNNPMNSLNPFYNPRTTVVPPLPPLTSKNQEVLYAVAIGTGGFVISNSNDLLQGLERIGKEMSEYYVLGYTPPSPEDGSCHALKVTTNKGGTVVRSRTGYCAVKPVDFLAGKPIAKELEAKALAQQPGDISGSVAAPFFYTGPGTARVNLAMDIAGSSIKFEKVKGRYHAVLNILGVATKQDGSVAARFSDAVELGFENKSQVDDFASKSYHYENQFYIGSGQYTLNVAVNTGDKYGKFDVPLNVDPYDKSQFSISSLALSKQFYKVADATNMDSELLQDRTPLVTQGLQIVPAASNQFKKSERAAIYVEVYEPLIAESKDAKVTLKLNITDQKTGKSELEAGIPETQSSVVPGNPVIPMGVPLPIDHLTPGTYVVQLVASDSAGNTSVARKAVFTVE
jgi:VWFA-related protein